MADFWASGSAQLGLLAQAPKTNAFATRALAAEKSSTAIVALPGGPLSQR